MILDGFLCFTAVPPGDAITTGTAVASLNVLDLHLTGIPSLASGVGARDWGIGDDPAIKVLAQVTVGITATTASTIQVSLQGAPDNGSGLPGTYYTFYSSAAFASGTGGIGTIGTRLLDMDMPRPPPGQPVPRFLRMLFTGAVGPFSTGAIFGALVIDRHDQSYQSTSNAVLGGYPAGINVAN